MSTGHGQPCYYCGKVISDIAADAGKWGIPLCHEDDPGVVKWHHISCVSALLEDLDRLKLAIRRHRDERGNDRCRLDDDRLYAELGEPIPDRPLPSKQDFLTECGRFWESRRTPGCVYVAQDTARLDWREANPKHSFGLYSDGQWADGFGGSHSTYRAAIDAAMANGAPA